MKLGLVFACLSAVSLFAMVLTGNDWDRAPSNSLPKVAGTHCYRDINVELSNTVNTAKNRRMPIKFWDHYHLLFHRLGLPPVGLRFSEGHGNMRVWHKFGCNQGEEAFKFLAKHFEAYGPEGAKVRLIGSLVEQTQ